MTALTRIRDFFYEPVDADPATTIEKRHDGVPVMPSTPVTRTVGTDGVGIYGGLVQEHERSPDLAGANRWKNFDDWKRTIAPVGGALRSYLFLAGSPEWTVEPYRADDAEEPLPEDIERAAFAQHQIHAMETEWERVIMWHAAALFDGFALSTWTAKLMPPGSLGAFGLLDIAPRPPSTVERWRLGEDGRVLGVVQASQDGVEIPIDRERLVYSRDLPTTTRPGGDGVMRFLAEAIRQTLELSKLRNKGFEKDVNGVPIIYAPIIEKMALIGQPKAGGGLYAKADFDREMAPVAAFISAEKRKDAGLALDSSTFLDSEGNPTSVRRFGAEVLSAQATSHDALNSALRELSWDILVLIGFEHLALGRDGAGSLAMHASKIAGTLRIVTSVLNGIAKTMRRDVLRPLWILNGFDPANPADPQNVPWLAWDALEFADLDGIVQSIAALLTAGSVEPGRADDAINKVLENMGMPTLTPVDDPDVELRREQKRDDAARAIGLKTQDTPTTLDGEED